LFISHKEAREAKEAKERVEEEKLGEGKILEQK